MKKISLLIAVFVIAGMAAFISSSAKAGSQTNWGTSTGANWVTPDDTKIQIGQALVVTSSIPYPTVGTSSTTPLGVGAFTLAQLKVITPPFLGEIIYCTDCTNTPLLISTGSPVNSWAGVYIATQNGTAVLTAAK